MNIKEILLAIAISVLTIFVIYYGINMFFPSPDYNNFCNNTQYIGVVNTSEQCNVIGGQWNPAYPNSIGTPKVTPEGYCDVYYKCNQEFNNAMKTRSRNVFYVALPLGILIIAVGAFLFGLEAVGAGLMGGGVGTLIYGAGAYWPFTENWVRFLISLIGLVLLIWFAYFFNKRMKKKKK
jgi:hypothetical protein